MKRSLLNGDVAIIPTDTVYGIAALAKNKKAVDKVFKISIYVAKSLEKLYFITAFSIWQIVLYSDDFIEMFDP